MQAIRENFKCELYVVWKFQEIFGEGVSVFDGLVRMDVARGVHPRRAWRVDLQLDSRF